MKTRLQADNPWKDVFEQKLGLVFDRLWRPVHESLDWLRDYENLDGELRKLTAGQKTGNRIADRLVKAFDKRSGDARFFHAEVQGKEEVDFEYRVNTCNNLAEVRYGQHVTSLVVLTDTNTDWRPSEYVSGNFPIEEAEEQEKPEEPVKKGKRGKKQEKKRVRYHDEKCLKFLMVKLIDFEGREKELEADLNPMGVFIVAHLTALRALRKPDRLKIVAAAKERLLLNLRQRKMTPDDVQFWEHCLDWFLELPPEMDNDIWDKLKALDSEQTMPFVSFAEKSGLAKGLEQGREQGLAKGLRQSLSSYLKAKYPKQAAALQKLLDAVSDNSRLGPLCDQVFAAENLDAVRDALAAAK